MWGRHACAAHLYPRTFSSSPGYCGDTSRTSLRINVRRLGNSCRPTFARGQRGPLRQTASVSFNATSQIGHTLEPWLRVRSPPAIGPIAAAKVLAKTSLRLSPTTSTPRPGWSRSQLQNLDPLKGCTGLPHVLDHSHERFSSGSARATGPASLSHREYHHPIDSLRRESEAAAACLTKARFAGIQRPEQESDSMAQSSTSV